MWRYLIVRSHLRLGHKKRPWVIKKKWRQLFCPIFVNAIEYLVESTPLDEKNVKICCEEKILKIATAIRTSYFNVGVCLPLQVFLPSHCLISSLNYCEVIIKKVLHTDLASIAPRNTIEIIISLKELWLTAFVKIITVFLESQQI